MFSFPPNKQWKQIGRSDVYGSLWSSYNVDLTTNQGKVRVSPRFIRATTTGDFTNPPVGVEYTNDLWLLVGPDANVWKAAAVNQILTGTFAADQSSSNYPTDLAADYSDIASFNQNIYISTNSTNLQKTSAGASYSSIASTSTSATKPKMLCVYGSRLYISQSAKIFSIDTSDTPQTTTTSDYAIDLNSYGAVITRMRASSQGIWIATANTFGGKGHVFFWNGVDHTTAQDFILSSSGALSLEIKDDVPWIMDADGRLLAFDGGSFKEVDRLPIDNKYLYNPLSSKNDRWIHPNGMQVVDGRIQVLIDTRSQASGNAMMERAPSGIWEYDPEFGFYHKASLSLYKFAAGAVGDYGQQKLTRVGFLKTIKSSSSDAANNGTTFAGASYYNGNLVASGVALWFDDFNDTVQKYGYIVTQKLYSQSPTDMWQKVYARYRKMLAATDKIWIKYRTEEDAPTYFDVTWTNAYTLATVTDLSGREGDEIEVIAGSGAGKTAHISAVSGSGPYSVTLDETFTLNTSDYTNAAAYCRVQTWKKASAVANQNTQLAGFNIGKPSTWIQFKICMQFTGKDELDDLIVVNTEHQQT